MAHEDDDIDDLTPPHTHKRLEDIAKAYILEKFDTVRTATKRKLRARGKQPPESFDRPCVSIGEGRDGKPAVWIHFDKLDVYIKALRGVVGDTLKLDGQPELKVIMAQDIRTEKQEKEAAEAKKEIEKDAKTGKKAHTRINAAKGSGRGRGKSDEAEEE